MATRKVYPVSVLNRYVKMLLDQDPLLSRLWVMGEISNFKRHTSGHLYFTLKDEAGAVNCVMFAQDARRLNFHPQSGDRVLALGQISLYEKTGTYQLYIREMEMDGVGRLYAAYEALKQQLETEGLFAQEKKKPIPQFPRSIGIITSPTGAAIRDIIQIAKRRDPGVRLILYPALVQGEGAAKTLVKGLQTLDAMEEVDTIILGRGGGSIEDLWPFNEEIVARAIAACETPVISAVGHETDFTIADFVADLRAPTPSAAAELAVVPLDSLLNGLTETSSRLRRAVELSLMKQKNELAGYGRLLSLRSPWMLVRDRMLEVEAGSERRAFLMQQGMERTERRLESYGKALDLLSPELPLKRGYALVLDAEEHVVASVRDQKAGQRLTVNLQDGRLQVRVEEIEQSE